MFIGRLKVKINVSTHCINTLQDLIDQFVELRGWIFRGHNNDSYRLESSLERYCTFGEYSSWAQSLEDYLLYEFKSRAHLYLSKDIVPNSKLGWLSLMQHLYAST